MSEPHLYEITAHLRIETCTEAELHGGSVLHDQIRADEVNDSLGRGHGFGLTLMFLNRELVSAVSVPRNDLRSRWAPTRSSSEMR